MFESLNVYPCFLWTIRTYSIRMYWHWFRCILHLKFVHNFRGCISSHKLDRSNELIIAVLRNKYVLSVTRDWKNISRSKSNTVQPPRNDNPMCQPFELRSLTVGAHLQTVREPGPNWVKNFASFAYANCRDTSCVYCFIDVKKILYFPWRIFRQNTLSFHFRPLSAHIGRLRWGGRERLIRELLVFWKTGRRGEVTAFKRWSQPEVRLYCQNHWEELVYRKTRAFAFEKDFLLICSYPG